MGQRKSRPANMCNSDNIMHNYLSYCAVNAIYETNNKKTESSNDVSYTKLKNTLKFRSVHTVQNYVRYIEETYLVLY